MAITNVPPLDPLAPENRANPYPFYHWLRENDPVRHAVDGSWILTRYADGAGLLRDHRFSPNPAWLREGAVAGAENHPIRQVGTSLMMFLDPPDHTRLRGLVSKAFTPKVVEAMRANVQRLVDSLLDEIGGEFDLVADLGYPLPVAVICDLLGVPPFDRDLFRRLSSDASRLLDGGALDAESLQKGTVAGMQLFQYFTDLVEQRRPDAKDRTDLLSAMIAAEEAGDTLSHPELITTATLLFVAGHETTSNLIGNGMLALLRNPDQMALLRDSDDPSLIRSAVEEFLRYDSPVQFVARMTTEDVEIAGQPIPAGEQLILVVGAMNRDPAQFPDPDRLDVTRPADANRHLSFSGGPHYCLGASLARLEAQVAISTLLRRYPDLELVTTEPSYRDHFVLRGVHELRVRVGE